jgi:hypothetical protein
MSEKLLRQFEHSWQAQIALEELEAINIKSRVETKPREYSSILLGGANDSIRIFVAESDFIRAADCIDKSLSRDVEGLDNSVGDLGNAGDEDKPVTNYFKRVILFSIMGNLILPLVFNFVATMNYLKLNKESSSFFLKTFALVFVLVSWVIAIYEVYFFASNYLH